MIEDKLNLDISLKSLDYIDNSVYHLTSIIEHAAWNPTPAEKYNGQHRTECPRTVMNFIYEKGDLGECGKFL